MDREREVISGIVVDEDFQCSLRELCAACGIHAELVIEMITEGVVDPQGTGPRDWRFSGPAIKRVQTTLRLQRDLGVNLAGAALALNLLEELEQARCLLRHRLDEF